MYWIITVLEHTRFEGSKLGKLKSSSSLLINNDDGQIIFRLDESEIEDKEFKYCETEDIKLFLSLN